jgi:hypothetical protein
MQDPATRHLDQSHPRADRIGTVGRSAVRPFVSQKPGDQCPGNGYGTDTITIKMLVGAPMRTAVPFREHHADLWHTTSSFSLDWK